MYVYIFICVMIINEIVNRIVFQQHIYIQKNSNLEIQMPDTYKLSCY